MEFLTSFLGVPKGIKFSTLKIGQINAEWFIPDSQNASVVILYLHGGGYGMGSINSHRALASRIALEAKAKILIIDYRLTPEFIFPAPVEDALTAYNFLLNSGYNSQNIVITGDSAGGGLSVALALKLKDIGIALPAGIVCMSPWTDLEASHHLRKDKAAQDPFIDILSIDIWGKLYAGHDIRNPLAAPIYADLTGLPPILIQVGTNEVLYHDSEVLAMNCNRDNVPCIFQIYPDMIHVFQMFAGFLPDSDKAIRAIALFINECINKQFINSR
jgi:phosphinothricin tripeptide acetyl hydrolase